MAHELKGVIAAITTPINNQAEPDCDILIDRARHMLENGCDGLNLLGTTGEATSFSVAQRVIVMERMAVANLPMSRIMVGTGAASLSDAVSLSRQAADLGFAAALLLPPFYYKPVSDAGLLGYFDAIVKATAHAELPLFLYNFPALSGITYTPDFVKLLMVEFGDRIGGLKDSSGDLEYAGTIAALSPTLRVFPSNEAILLRAREGEFAGCISATANLNHEDCGKAFHEGDEAALARAVAARNVFSGLPLVPGIKHTLARRLGKPEIARLVPPLSELTAEQSTELETRLLAIAEV